MNIQKNYEVHTPMFEGPLDLLLHLIRKNDLDIGDITVSTITGEFLEYVNLMKELNLELAGEFLVMAATLLEIKARAMLPTEGIDEEAEKFITDLKDKLSEYQKYKHVATLLADYESRNKDVFYRVRPEFDFENYTLDASLFDLLDTFKKIIQVLPDDVKKIVYEEIPIERKIAEILELIRDKKFASFTEILTREKSRMGMIVSFLAVLELIRLGQLIARQKESFGEIRIYIVEYKQEDEISSAPIDSHESGEK